MVIEAVTDGHSRIKVQAHGAGVHEQQHDALDHIARDVPAGEEVPEVHLIEHTVDADDALSGEGGAQARGGHDEGREHDHDSGGKEPDK